MISPYKLADITENYKHISSNIHLAKQLKSFFSLEENSKLWDINITRQTTTEALRNTKMIGLRVNTDETNQAKTTLEWNNSLTLTNDPIVHFIPYFRDVYRYINLLFYGKCSIELGRVFFSKLSANSVIDLHTDTGKYFEYYDRFHFVIDGNDENIFYIREEPIVLKTGNVYWVNNHVPHRLENNSSTDRINLIFDARLKP